MARQWLFSRCQTRSCETSPQTSCHVSSQVRASSFLTRPPLPRTEFQIALTSTATSLIPLIRLYSLLAEDDPAARTDYWGGGLARQAIVFAIALENTPRADDAERRVSLMFAPVATSHRITVAQMAMLEPALSETLTNGCISVIREGLERVIRDGVPEPAAKDFLMGHLQIGIAIIFEQFDWRLSEGATAALANAKGALFRADWEDIFSADAFTASLKEITGGD